MEALAVIVAIAIIIAWWALVIFSVKRIWRYSGSNRPWYEKVTETPRGADPELVDARATAMFLGGLFALGTAKYGSFLAGEKLGGWEIVLFAIVFVFGVVWGRPWRIYTRSHPGPADVPPNADVVAEREPADLAVIRLAHGTRWVVAVVSTIYLIHTAVRVFLIPA